METKTCFVIMPISGRKYENIEVTDGDLRSRYYDLIKEAINRVRPDLEVIRADEVSMSGTISTDIVMRIMRSDYVIADVSYPNPNVFYELGLRHACRAGTIILKDKSSSSPPFDISHLRYVEYENTPSGLKDLAKNLHRFFEEIDKNPKRPDNHFLEIAKLTEYDFPSYAKKKEKPEEMWLKVFKSPLMMDFALRAAQGEQVDQSQIILAMMSDPEIADVMLKMVLSSSEIKNQLPGFEE